jgi:cytochrome b561
MDVSSSLPPGATSSSAQPSTSRSDARYTRTAIALHWVVAALVVVQVAWGWAMQEIPKQPPGLRADAFNVHKSIGITIFMLMLVRVGWRIAHPPPALPPMPRWQRRLARLNHGVLYAALLVMPVAGFLGSVYSGYPIRAFGFTWPAFGAKDEGLKTLMSVVHLWTSWVLVAAIGLHLAGAAHHALGHGDRVLQRMIPRRAGGRPGGRA